MPVEKLTEFTQRQWGLSSVACSIPISFVVPQDCPGLSSRPRIVRKTSAMSRKSNALAAYLSRKNFALNEPTTHHVSGVRRARVDSLP